MDWQITYNTVAAATKDRALEASVFGEFFGNTSEELQAAYGKYERHSFFLSCWHLPDSVLAGTMRITIPGFGSSKTLDDLSGDPWWLEPRIVVERAGIDLPRTADIATIAAAEEFRSNRGGEAADRLFAGLNKWSQDAGIRYLTALLDDEVRESMASGGIVFRRLPGTQSASYMGSPATSPVFVDLAVLRAELALGHPERWKQLSEPADTVFPTREAAGGYPAAA